MLIVTYSLVTLSLEQEKTRHVLSTLQQRTQRYAAQSQYRDAYGLESILNQFTHFDDTCRQRNVELYVIPAIRRATREADCLLAELEAFSAAGSAVLAAVRNRLERDIEQGVQKIKELAGSMELYCHHLLTRLSKEEEQLFPIARRVITSEEEWFAIAAQFISQDEKLHAYKPPIVASTPAAAGYAHARHDFAANRNAHMLELN